MPWNQPGNQNGNNPDPWGNRDKRETGGPPDLDKIVADIIRKLRAFFSGKKPSTPPMRQKTVKDIAENTPAIHIGEII